MRNVFKETGKEDALSVTYLSNLHGIGRINELISVKYLETIKEV